MPDKHMHTPSTHKADVNEQFAELQQNYLGKIEQKYQEIADNWHHYDPQQQDARDTLTSLYRCLHTMAGTSGILGIDAISQLARNAELLLIGKEVLDDDDERRLQQLLTELDQLIHQDEIEVREIIITQKVMTH